MSIFHRCQSAFFSLAISVLMAAPLLAFGGEDHQLRCEATLSAQPAGSARSVEAFEANLKEALTPELFERLGEDRQTTTEENQFWMDNAYTLQHPNRLAFIFEVPVVKEINDGIMVGNKGLVNVLLNYLKVSLKAKLLDTLPNYLELHWYSDFKSLGLIVDTRGVDVPERFLRTQVSEALQESLATFDGLILRTSPHAGFYRSLRPSSWFKGGGGQNPQFASVAARLARYSPLERPQSSVYWFHEEGARHLSLLLGDIEALREVLFGSLQKSDPYLFAPSGSVNVPEWKSLDLTTLNLEVFKAFRTATDEEHFDLLMGRRFPELKQRAGSALISKQLWKYYGLLDQVLPPIYSAERTYASLTASDVGGATIDFVGLGALNIMAVDLALSQFFSHPLAPEEVITFIKERELDLTRSIQLQRTLLSGALMELTEQLGWTDIESTEFYCSADDCAVVFKSEQPERKAEAFAQSLELIPKLLSWYRTFEINSFRTVFVGNLEAPAEGKDTLTGHGESIEKKWRKQLFESGLSIEQQNSLFSTFVMRGALPAEGAVDIYYVTAQEVSQELLEQALEAAVQVTNEVLGTNYSPGQVLEATEEAEVFNGPILGWNAKSL